MWCEEELTPQEQYAERRRIEEKLPKVITRLCRVTETGLQLWIYQQTFDCGVRNGVDWKATRDHYMTTFLDNKIVITKSVLCKNEGDPNETRTTVKIQFDDRKGDPFFEVEAPDLLYLVEILEKTKGGKKPLERVLDELLV
jgi:hypothetical protein